MKIKFISSFVLMFLTVFVFGQAETRNISNYTKLDVKGSITVDLVKNGNMTAKVEVLKGDLNDLVTDVSNGRLIIKFKEKQSNDSWDSGQKAKITLAYSNLEAIDASAGATIRSSSKLSTNDITLSANSGSSLQLEIKANKSDLECSSGASMTVKGSSKKVIAEASSGATLDGSLLIATDVHAKASSGASLLVHAKESIRAEASSGASIKYGGNPAEKNIEDGKWSGGNISKAN